METTITATDLARSLSDVLNRVKYRGERFVVVRNGETIAALGPTESPKAITLRELAALLRELPPIDADFADDLERIQAEQPKAVFHEWPK